MNSQISSLQRMENMLYGGYGSYSSAPSVMNGYRADSAMLNSIYSNPYLNPYGYSYYPSFGQNVSQHVKSNSSSNNSGNTSSSTFQGLTPKEEEALLSYFSKSFEPSESLKSAVITGGIMGGLMMNPRMIVHPINSITTAFKGDTKEMFKGIKKGGAIHELWKKNHFILEEAYSQMNRAEARSKWKLGLFRNRYTKEEYTQLKEIMEKALKTGNVDEVAKATETLRHAYCRNGKLFQGWNWLKKQLGFKGEVQSVSAMLKDSTTIANNTKTLLGYNKMNLKKAFVRTGGWLGLAMGAVEILMNWGKIETAKQKDAENAKKGIQSNLGATQTKQTFIKAIGNTLGWCAGETLSVMAAAKWGAGIGTALGGLPGTVVGAIIGFVGGSLGMWVAGRITRGIVKDDVSNKIEAERVVQTSEGQTELLKYTLEKIQKGEKVPPDVQQATMKILNQYA